MAVWFHKAFCDMCGRETYHSPSGCTDHSNLQVIDTPNGPQLKVRRRVELGIMITARLTKEHVAPTEAELRRMNRIERTMLRAADTKFSGVSLAGYEWALGMFPEDPPADAMPDPNQILCSFCGNPTERLDLTTEKKPHLRFHTTAIKNADGDIEIRNRVEVTSETVNACPDCCLNIRKPITVQRI